MTVKELAKSLDARVLTCEDQLCGEVTGCYIGDLLSWVMSRAECGDAWLTIMGNINAVAVAALADVSCVILTENAVLDTPAREKAEEQNIIFLQTEETGYKTAIKIYKLLEE